MSQISYPPPTEGCMGEQTSIEFDLTYSQRVTQMEIMILNNNNKKMHKDGLITFALFGERE